MTSTGECCSVENLLKMGVSNISADAIKSRITILDKLWSKFEAQHELIRMALKENYPKSEYAKSDFIDVAVLRVLTCRSKARCLGTRTN